MVCVSSTSCLPLSRFPSSAVLSRAADEPPVVARPGPGGEKRLGGWASPDEACAVIGALLLPCAATRVSLHAVWCLRGATPRESAVDARRDTTTVVRRAEHAVDGGVDMPR